MLSRLCVLNTPLLTLIWMYVIMQALIILINVPSQTFTTWRWRQIMTFESCKSKNVLPFCKELVESFSTRQVLVFIQGGKKAFVRSYGLFWVFGGCARARSSLLFFYVLLRWCKHVPGEQTRFRWHACPNSQVTKLFLECIQPLLEEGGKKLLTLLSVQGVMNKWQAETDDFYLEGNNRVR